jgi:hypothetical protein
MASRRVNLSVVQVASGVLAALTGAVAASFLGVGGTLVGAAVGSAASTIGTEVYRHYLERTHERLRGVVDVRRYRTARSAVVGQVDPTVAQNRLGVTSRREDDEDATETQVLHVQRDTAHGAVTAQRSDSFNEPIPDPLPETLAAADSRPRAARAETAAAAAAGSAAEGSGGTRKMPRWLMLAAVTAGMFVIAVAAITVFELSVGKTLSATVKGQSGSGTTLGGVVGGQTTRPTPPATKQTGSATPTVSPSSTASVAPTSSGSAGATPAPSITITPGAATPTPSS